MKGPTELGYNYQELCGMDDVSVTLVPEKQGVVFKHVEYVVESKVGGAERLTSLFVRWAGLRDSPPCLLGGWG